MGEEDVRFPEIRDRFYELCRYVGGEPAGYGESRPGETGHVKGVCELRKRPDMDTLETISRGILRNRDVLLEKVWGSTYNFVYRDKSGRRTVVSYISELGREYRRGPFVMLTLVERYRVIDDPDVLRSARTEHVEENLPVGCLMDFDVWKRWPSLEVICIGEAKAEKLEEMTKKLFSIFRDARESVEEGLGHLIKW
jgi:hypothetical protein